MKTVLAVIGAVVVLLAVIGSLDKTHTADTVSSSGSAAATTVTFEVTGVAGNGVTISYGTDTSNYGGRLPLYKTMVIDQDASYYDVTAQLNGQGSVSCSVTIGGAVSKGHALGGYNICSAQLNHIGDSWEH